MEYTIIHVPNNTIHFSQYWKHLLDLSLLNHNTISEAGIYEKEYFTTQIINYLLYPQIAASAFSYLLKTIQLDEYEYYYYFIYVVIFYMSLIFIASPQFSNQHISFNYYLFSALYSFAFQNYYFLPMTLFLYLLSYRIYFKYFQHINYYYLCVFILPVIWICFIQAVILQTIVLFLGMYITFLIYRINQIGIYSLTTKDSQFVSLLLYPLMITPFIQHQY